MPKTVAPRAVCVASAWSRSRYAVLRIVEHAGIVAVIELRLRVGLHRVLEPPRQVRIRERHRPVLRDRRGEDVELLVAEHVGERHLRAAEQVAAARDADVDRRAPLEEQLLERALRLDVRLDQRVADRRLEVDDRASGEPKSALATVCSGSSRGSVWMPYSPL